MIRRMHIYSEALDLIERSSSRAFEDHYKEFCTILETVFGKSSAEDITIETQQLPRLIASIEERLHVLLENRPSPTKVLRDNERYYEKKILGQSIIFESDYDDLMGTLDAWMRLIKKAWDCKCDIQFLFTLLDFHDSSLLSLFRKYQQMSLSESIHRLNSEKRQEEPSSLVEERINRLVGSGLLDVLTREKTVLYSITSKGEKVLF
jgi:hypothetical protein